MRKEMDELRSAIKERTDRSVDKMVRATDSPFTVAVLNALYRQSFAYLNSSHLTDLKTLRIILIPLRRL